MIDPFWLRVTAAFIVGGLWVSVTTIVAEKFGSKIGGFLGGLPSTVVVSFLFIGLTQPMETVVRATDAFPLVYSVTGFFLLIVAFMVKRGIGLAIVAALVAWGLLQGLIIKSGFHQLQIAFVVWVIVLLSTVFIFERRMKLLSHGRGAMTYTVGQVTIRAMFSGLVVAGAVVASRLGGPIYGGIFSSFPAMFISTLVIAARSRGWEFAQSLTKPLFVSGMITVVSYAIAVRYSYPAFGVGWGTVIAYALTMIPAFITYLFILRRLA